MHYDQETLRRLQLTELEILKVVDGFCKEQGIAYFLEAGTALGAMRHGGFIPWDDDIDIGMLRSDYEKFLRVAADGLPAGYSLHTFDNTPGFANMFAKVYKDGTAFDIAETIDAGCEQCIFIDVFPYDVVSDDRRERTRQLKSAHMWQMVSYLYHAHRLMLPGSGMKRTVLEAGCMAAHVGIKALFKRDAIKERFEAALTPRVMPATRYQSFAYPLPHDLELDVLMPPTERLFEGRLFPCPARTADYLCAMYGPTWTELPPESERKTHAPVNLEFSVSQPPSA